MKKILLFTLTALFISSVNTPLTIVEAKSKPIIKKVLPKTEALHKFKIKAAIIRGNGDIIPGAKIQIIFWGYDKKALNQKYLEINSPTEKRPNLNDEKYQIDCITIISKNCKSDFEAYDKDVSKWEDIAYKGVSEEIKEINKTHKYYEVNTNLSGEATMKLPKGTWYIWAGWENSTSIVDWSYVPLEVDNNLEIFEMSNDNATSVFNKH